MMAMNSLHYGCIERKELEVLCRSRSRRKQIDSGISHDRPVAMLAGTVDTIKRLLMENHFKSMSFSNFLHDNHKHHILIDSFCSLTEHRSTLELVRCDLIVSCLQKDSQLICFSLEVLHERTHS